VVAAPNRAAGGDKILENVEMAVDPLKGNILRAKRRFAAGDELFSDPALFTVDTRHYGRELAALERICAEIDALASERDSMEGVDPLSFLPILQVLDASRWRPLHSAALFT
jgi:hypothetical protein